MPLDLAAARMIHVLAVVVWIGGVFFVTAVVFPTVRRTEPPEARLAAFLRLEEPFAAVARLSVAAAGVSGAYLAWRMALWSRFAEPRFWWMHAMVALWAIFALVLYVFEPLLLHRRMQRLIAAGGSGAFFDRFELFHRLMSALGMVTIAGAAGGSHGAFL